MTYSSAFQAEPRADVGRRSDGRARLPVCPRAAVAAALILAVPFGASSCASVDRIVTVFRSTEGFVASPDDPRVFYEPGAEALARPVVVGLPGAIAKVEAASYGPFTVPIRIYVCGTLECYRRFTGNDRSGGQTNPRRKIFISPKPENTAARVPFVVAHELTHLHLVQGCSVYRAAQMPVWFNEGFAALVSDGGGAEGVSDADAARAILAGRTFTPTTDYGFSGSHFGLPAHLFYRQAALFIAYLRAHDGGAFRAFILDLEGGRPFGPAFEARFHSELTPSWQTFVGALAIVSSRRGSACPGSPARLSGCSYCCLPAQSSVFSRGADDGDERRMLSHLMLVLALGAVPDAGAGPGASSSSPPSSIFGPDTALAPGTPVKGNLDKEIIRRIIRRHIDEVNACYQRALARHPFLFGQIVVKFSIDAVGDVVAAVPQSSTMDDDKLEACTVDAVRRWEFPKPLGGGRVVVSYPFVMKPGFPIPIVAGTAGAGTVVLDLALFDRGIIVHRSTDAHGVPANGVIAVTEGGLLLFDTGWTTSQTEAILKWGDDRLKLPWVGAVITHDHGDRDGGLAALQRRRIPVAALDLTVAKLARRGIHGVDVLFAAKDGAIQDPRGFEAFYPGPGHTSDNIVIRHDDVLFAGCLLKSMEAKEIGFTGDADLPAWPAAIGRVAARYGNKVTVIPGHGAIDSTGRAYQHTLDLLRTSSMRP